MTTPIAIHPFSPADKAACMALFDANCPAFFAPNEREEYREFLDAAGEGYALCRAGGSAVAAFGVATSAATARAHLNWVMVHPDAKGGGIGTAILAEARRRAEAAGCLVVDISASHLSAPFFARFGAARTRVTEDGWGPGMHRVDMEWQLQSVFEPGGNAVRRSQSPGDSENTANKEN